MSGQQDLSARVRDGGPLAAGQVLSVVNAVAGDVDARIGAGTPHAHISPSALGVAPDGTVRLTPGTNPTEAEAHAAPEVLAGSAPDARSEVFSLASTTYTLLTGQPPNPYGFATVRRARPDLSPTVDGVLAQATARGPEFRYPTATAFAAALTAALGVPEEPLAPAVRPGYPVPPVRTVEGSADAARPGRPTGPRPTVPDAALPFIFLGLIVLLVVVFVAIFL